MIKSGQLRQRADPIYQTETEITQDRGLLNLKQNGSGVLVHRSLRGAFIFSCANNSPAPTTDLWSKKFAAIGNGVISIKCTLSPWRISSTRRYFSCTKGGGRDLNDQSYRTTYWCVVSNCKPSVPAPRKSINHNAHLSRKRLVLACGGKRSFT